MTSIPFPNLAFDAVGELAAADSVERLVARLIHITGELGLTSLLIAECPPQAASVAPIVLANGTPRGMMELYEHENLFSVDPYATRLRTANEPFTFEEVRSQLRGRSAASKLTRAQIEFGIPNGIVIPTGRTNNLVSSITLAGREPNLQPEARRGVELIALYAMSRLRALLRAETPTIRGVLTVRERETLKWIAAGKTSWEISRMTSITERGVNKTIANAMTKLDAVTRAQAVVNAIRLGEIQL